MTNETVGTFFINCTVIHRVPVHGIYHKIVVAHFAFTCLLGVCIIIPNTLIMLVIYTKPSLQTSANVFTFFMAFSDTLIGLVSIPWAVNFILALFSKQNCFLYLSTVSFGYGMIILAIVTVFATALDRYIAIFKPYYYWEKSEQIKPWYIKFLVLTFITAMTIAGLSLLTFQFTLAKAAIVILAPITLLPSTIIHVKIYLTVRKITRQIYPQHAIKGKKIKPIDHKAYMIALTLTASYIGCYIPIFFHLVYQITTGDTSDAAATIFIWLVAVGGVKSLLNPLIYINQLAPIREGIKKFLQSK